MGFKKFFGNFKTKILDSFGKNKKMLTISVVIIVLVLFVIFAFPKKTKSESNNTSSKNLSQNNSLDYEAELEQKIKNMLLAIDEVSSANVMIVCETSVSYNYLKNKDETTTTSDGSSSKVTSEEVAYEKNGSNSAPIIVSKNMPKVVGVWVVLNAVSASTKLSIIKSLSVVLNIDETSISILQER